MSLLIDALKKAEAAKRENDLASPTQPTETKIAPKVPLEALASDSLQLQPLERRAPADLNLRRDDINSSASTAQKTGTPPASAATAAYQAPQQTARHEPSVGASKAPAQPVRTSQAIPNTAGQTAARNLFAAKQSADKRRNFIVGISIFTLLAIAGIGGYFWLQLHPSAGKTPPAPLSPLAAPPLRAAPTPALLSPPPTAETSTKPAAGLSAETLSSRPVANPPPPADIPIRITRNKPRINPQVEQAFEAFQAGRIEVARNAYEQALRAEPNNSDALHGLAAIALKTNQPARAVELYQQALNADPKDALAHAALISLAGQQSSPQAESQLKSVIAEQPNSAAAHLALGNLYARQKRWREAQQAYFSAYAAEPENPDLAFNLAVSLEQLHQPKLAIQYYSEALTLAAKRPASFDPAQAALHLSNLKP